MTYDPTEIPTHVEIRDEDERRRKAQLERVRGSAATPSPFAPHAEPVVERASGYTAEQLISMLTPKGNRTATCWRWVRSYEVLDRPGIAAELVEEIDGQPLQVIAMRTAPTLIEAIYELHLEMSRRAVAWSRHRRRSP